MNIDEFNVSHECRHELVRVGFATVEEVVEFLEEQAQGHALIQAGWIKCFDEIIEQLKLLDFWSEMMEQAWPEDIMKP